MIRSVVIFAVACLALTAPGSALAQEDAVDPAAADPLPAGDFSLELNNAAEISTGGCRLTYVATNGSAESLTQIAYEVAVFDANGIVSRLLVLEFGALTPGRTKVVQFDLADQPCADISRIIVNDVASCALDGGGTGMACMELLSTSSRASIQFGL